VTTDRDRILSEFIDAWNAGRRPDPDAFLARAAEPERDTLEHEMLEYVRWAPTPDFDEATVAAIREEPAVAAAFEHHRAPAGSWLRRAREEASLSTAQLARSLVGSLGLDRKGEDKTRAYIERAEAGELELSGFSQRLIAALTAALRVPRERFEAAIEPLTAARAAPQFRADEVAAEAIRDDLDLMADAMSTRSQRDWDEVDELFRGGR
jgi:transcriptional regulator with XRE-family HTH domain